MAASTVFMKLFFANLRRSKTGVLVLSCLAILCCLTTTTKGFQIFNHGPKLKQRMHNILDRSRSSQSLQHLLRTRTNNIIIPSVDRSTSQLNAIPGFSSSPLGSIAVLAGIIVVHESGHYLAARTFNITVEEFSVGFGRKLFGFEKFGNEFNVRALPLGGYVRFPENYDRELLEEKEQLIREKRFKIRELESERSKKNQKEWNWKEEILDAATLGFWREQKYENERKKRSVERELNEKARLDQLQSTPWWKRPFTKIGISKSTGTDNNDSSDEYNNIDKVYEKLDEIESIQIEYSDDPKLLQNRPWQERAIVLSGGVIFNLIFAFTVYFGQIGPIGGQVTTTNGGGLPRAIYGNGVIVNQVNRGPSEGLLQNGDIITSINGRPVQIGSQKTSITAGQKQVNDVITAIRKTSDGDTVSVQVLRAEAGISSVGTSISKNEVSSDEDAKSITATTSTAKQVPTISSKTLSIRPQRVDGTTQTIGVLLSPNVEKVERLKSDNPIVAFKLAWEYLSDIFTQTLVGTISALSAFILPSDPTPGQKISGPIGLIQQGSSVVATKDWTAVWLFAAGLSVNLGVINALPVPALDGGQLVFVIAEALTGKKVDQKFQENITSIAVLFFLWLSLTAAVGDVGSLVSGLR